MRKISIIIPCYNVAQYVDRCIRSIAVQTIGVENLEIICIDDASTDNTWECLKKWEQAFPENVLLVKQDVNRRQGAARNLGLQFASADWIAFVDADDWLEPDYFEQLYTPVKKHVYDVVVCGFRLDYTESLTYFEEKDRDRGKDEYIRADTKESKKEIFVHKMLNVYAWGKIIRKELLLKYQIYFPEELVYEDNYWHPLLHIYADNIYIIRKKLYHYFVRASSTVNVRNVDHYVDRITVQLMKWEDYERRGLLQEYLEELEWDFLQHAIYFLESLVFRYDEPSYSYYQIQREVVWQKIPDYVMDMYRNAFPGIQGACFDALYYPLNKAGFQIFVKRLKEMTL